MKCIYFMNIFLLFFVSCENIEKKSIISFENLLEINSNIALKKDLHEIFKDKKIVLLGEQSHGDGTTFKAKAQLIKYLIENEGFNKLFFESSRYNLNNCNSYIENGGDLEVYMDSNLYRIWSRPKCNKRFFRYLEQSNAKIFGLDIQFSGKSRSKELKKELLNVLNLNQNEKEILVKGMDYIGNWIINDSSYSIDSIEWEKFKDLIKSESLNHSYDRILDPIIEFKDRIRQGRSYVGLYAYRDSMMFENLKSQINKNDKVIVWGASAHFVRNISSIEIMDMEASYKGFKTLGGFIYNQYSNEDLLSLAFSGAKGQYLDYFDEQKYKVELTDSNCIERELRLKDYGHAIIDLSINYDSVRVSQMMGSYSNFKANWSNHFDYLFYSDVLDAVSYN